MQITAPQTAIAHIIADKSSGTITPQEAADYIGAAVATMAIWRCTKRYPLPYIKVGRLVRYRISDLDTFLNSRTISV